MWFLLSRSYLKNHKGTFPDCPHVMFGDPPQLAHNDRRARFLDFGPQRRVEIDEPDFAPKYTSTQ